ncbi:DUF7196 family protein [Nocardia wallacei]|uniref:DUF7196 family protein n=1 Tax=Nocardia wallacei TaxID=480035 RepID=UPI003CC7FDC5
MGCNCGGAKASRATQSKYKVTGLDGKTYGPYFTQTEARIKLQEIGGGVMTPVSAE